MATSSAPGKPWVSGGLMFAASILLMVGVWQALVGIAAIANDEFLVQNRGYTYDIDTTAWGWFHLVLGVLAVLAGVYLFVSAALWARAIGIALAGLSAVNNFIFLPYYPLWALTVIGVDMIIIWSLASTHPSWERPVPDWAGYDAEKEAPRSRHAPIDRPMPNPADMPPLGRL